MTASEDDRMVVDVDIAPRHVIQLQQNGDEHRAVCCCNRYESRWTTVRQQAFRRGKAHVAYQLKKWRTAL